MDLKEWRERPLSLLPNTHLQKPAGVMIKSLGSAQVQSLAPSFIQSANHRDEISSLVEVRSGPGCKGFTHGLEQSSPQGFYYYWAPDIM